MINLRQIKKLLQETFSEWQFNEVSLLASSLAYYTVFSLAPLMAIVIIIVGAIFDEATAREQLIAQMSELFGAEGAELMATAIDYMRSDANERQPFQLIVNIGFLIAGATGIFAQIQDALNRIWKVKPTPGRKLFHFLRKRLLTFIMVLAIALLLLTSFLSNSLLAAIVEILNNIVPGSGFWWRILSFLASFGVTTTIFALMYTLLPDVEIPWRDTFVGAITTAVLFLIGQFLFGLFLSNTDFSFFDCFTTRNLACSSSINRLCFIATSRRKFTNASDYARFD